MATSIVARIIFLLAATSVAYAQTVQPSNITVPDSAMTQMTLTGGPLFKAQSPFNIVPLTSNVGQGQNAVTLRQISFQGFIKEADPQTSMNLTASDIAYISCDPNGSNIEPSQLVANAGALKPKAIVLYSLQFNECNLTGPTSYTTIYSMSSAKDAQSILTTIGFYPDTTNILSAMIGSNTTSSAGASPTNDNNNGGGPAPTTAVAMSILYSITGIITLLFLVIIATGAVRAHRHPERYGPRNGYAGRPRQSRAKGLARAMLETLPIVKFGDPEPVKPGSTDVELEHGNTSHAAPTDTTPQQEDATTSQTKLPPVETAAVASGMGAAHDGSTKDATTEAAIPPAAPKEGELGCSICTEDFTTGEDVRVLPCQHKYHPACIDPWLLNVSGTCPLCRHDLRPETSAGPADNTDAATRASADLPPPLDVEGEVAETSEETIHQRRRISRFLDLSRLRTAPPEERIAALRELREQSRTEEATENVEEQQGRRARLTGKLRDTFRIRTRAQ